MKQIFTSCLNGNEYAITERVKNIREVQLDLLKIVKKICLDHKLKYYLWGDTLRGAMLCQGFQLYDDNICVIMPRKDFEDFQKVFTREGSYPYEIQTNENSQGIFRNTIIRLKNVNTAGVEISTLEKDAAWGIWINIFCLDYVFKEQKKRRKQLRKIGIMSRLCTIKSLEERGEALKNFSYVKKIIYYIIIKTCSLKLLLKGYDKICTACGEKEGGFYSEFSAKSPEEFRLFDLDFFEPYNTVTFENEEFAAPQKFEEYIKMFPEKQYEDNKNTIFQDGILLDSETKGRDLRHRLCDTFHIGPEKEIYVWGSGIMFDDYMEKYGKKYCPKYIIDSNPQKWGMEKYGIIIGSQEILRRVPMYKVHLIICNIYYREIEKQLKEWGITEYYLYIQNKNWLNTILFPLEQYPEINLIEHPKPLLSDEPTLAEDLLHEDCYPVNNRSKHLDFRMKCRLDIQTGNVKRGFSGYAATEFFYKARPGNKVYFLNNIYCYYVAIYEIRNELDKERAYFPEENWAIYNNSTSNNEFIQTEYTFSQEVWFRVCVRRVDEQDLQDRERISIEESFVFETYDADYNPKSCFESEISNTVCTVNARKKEGGIVFALMSDSHFTVSGTWEDTLNNLKSVHDQVHFDMLIHLGDLTDGITPENITEAYAKVMIEQLEELGIPIFNCLGNHDTNYFWYNREELTEEKMSDLYIKHTEKYGAIHEESKLWYYVDIPKKKLRLIFLSGFNNRRIQKYGFPNEEIEWLDQVLRETAESYKIVIFSHIPPKDEIHCLNNRHTIENSNKLIGLLKRYNMANSQKILALFYGHNHSDNIYCKEGFPIIGIGCNKCEQGLASKNFGDVQPDRELNDKTQDLWDVVLLHSEEKEIDMIRFGAGSDRTIICV